MRVKLYYRPTWGGKETLYGLQENRETEGEKKDSVDQSSQYLCSVPSVRVSCIDVLLISELLFRCRMVSNVSPEQVWKANDLL